MATYSPLSAMATIRTLLTADSTLVGMVPVSRMYPASMPTVEPGGTPLVFPLIVYTVLDEPDTQYADDLAKAETATIEIQVWQNIGGVTPTTIAQRIATIFRADGWDRYFSAPFRYTVNGQPYHVLRFSKYLQYS